MSPAHLRHRRRGARSLSVGLGLSSVALVLFACSSSNSPEVSPTTATVDAVASPTGDLYTPPAPLDPAPPGTLIWAERVDGIDLNPPATIWRVLYHSLGSDGQDTAVSGFAVVPTSEAPDPRPVYAWGHGTAGLGDQCAPSHEIRDNLPPFGGQQVERGAVLVATDYEGLGTPGVPTNANGMAEGRAVLDSVRAVASLPDVGRLGDVVVAGHSQGGAAALFASEIAADYAPELRLVGTLALAPSAELPALADTLARSSYRGLDVIGAAALRSANPDLDLSAVLSQETIEDLRRVESECLDDTVDRYRATDMATAIIGLPSGDPAVRALLEKGSPGSVRIDVPLFIAHGSVDEQVPPDLTERLQEKYCAFDTGSTRRLYQGADHDGVIDAAADDALAFITARFDSKPATNGCA